MERPFILINFAISADGKIGTAQKGPSRFTSPADLTRLLQIRQRADAILVGRGTLEADQMSMTIPCDLKPKKQPLRCVISRRGIFDESHKLFHTEGGTVHLITTNKDTPRPESPPESSTLRHHQLSLRDFLSHAKTKLGVETLLCEGGGSLANALFELDAIDEIHLTVAGHSLIGGQGAPTLTGIPSAFLPASRTFTLSHFEPTQEEELFATWTRQRTSSALPAQGETTLPR